MVFFFVGGKFKNMKKCNKCGVEKNFDEFYKNKKSKDNYSNFCKICFEEKRKEQQNKRKILNENRIIIIKEKQCCKCKKIKNIDCFYIELINTDGYSYSCIECRRSEGLNLKNKKLEPARAAKKLKKEQEKLLVGDNKRCAHCKEIKSKDNYVKNKIRKDGLNYQCKNCDKESKIKGRNKNKEKNKNLIINITEIKQCYMCKEIKTKNNFSKRLASVDSLEGFCKVCKKINKQKYINNLIETNKSATFDPYKPKYCTKCNQFKNRDNFHENLAHPDGLQSRCKPCQNKTVNISTNSRARQAYIDNYKPISEQDILDLINKSNNKCAYCKTDVMLGRNLHIDHIKALSKGGPHIIDNLAISCDKCNYRKGAMNKEDFLIKLQKIQEAEKKER